MRSRGRWVVSNIEQEVYRDAAGAVWDALLGGYARVGLIVGGLALAIGLAAWWFRRSAARTTPIAGGASV